MGNLVTETPFSEITATMEALDHLGVERHHLEKFRAAHPDARAHIADLFKRADTLVPIPAVARRKPMEGLIERSPVTVTLAFDHDAQEVWREGGRPWWVSEEFRRVVAFGGESFAQQSATLRRFELKTLKTEGELRAQIKPREDFSVMQPSWLLSTLMIQQAEGRRGPLRSKGSANLFFTGEELRIQNGEETDYVISLVRLDPGPWYADAKEQSRVRMWPPGTMVFVI